MIRLLGYFFGIACVMFLGAAAVVAVYLANVAKDLPDYAVLNSYAPPVTTRVHVLGAQRQILEQAPAYGAGAIRLRF